MEAYQISKLFKTASDFVQSVPHLHQRLYFILWNCEWRDW